MPLCVQDSTSIAGTHLARTGSAHRVMEVYEAPGSRPVGQAQLLM